MNNSRRPQFTTFITVLSFTVLLLQSCEWITNSSVTDTKEVISLPGADSELEIGSEVTILWEISSFPSDEVKIDLYKADSLILIIHPNSPNDGYQIWKIPEDVPWGDSFRIRITDIEQGEKQVFSDGYFILYKYVNFIDEHLRTQIQNSLNLSESNITTYDLSFLEWFEGSDISDLTGIEFCTNLRVLSLKASTFSDISQLTNLKNLLNLRMIVINLDDISPIVGLTNLTLLSLKYCGLTDIRPISNLSNFISLELTGNTISDMSFLSSLKRLKYLNIKFNLTSNIDWIPALVNLQRLNLSSNQLSNIDPLATMTSIRELDLSWNTIRNIESLTNLRNISILNLAHNLVQNVTPLLDNPGIGLGDTIYLGGTNVNMNSFGVVELRNRGVRVIFSPSSS